MSNKSIVEKDYAEFLQSLKLRVQQAQIRAMLSVNRELVLLYWQIGREILERQRQQGWGAKVIERLSKDLRSAFPEMKGFSRTNLLYMRALAEAYSGEEFVQQAVGQIPWGHNVRILDYVKKLEEREFYIQKTIENGWSRNVLVLQIESRLYERQGKAVTNFYSTLPAPQSDLAQNLLKDPYNFDFLTLGAAAHERDWKTLYCKICENSCSNSESVSRLSAVSIISKSAGRIFTLTCCFIICACAPLS
jgi:predicted nuclease of restriction endonuclease-like (RecB) superfamily